MAIVDPAHRQRPAAPAPDVAAVEPLVRFQGVRKSYDGRQFVVQNLDLDVLRGEFLTMLGPSGSGKTTTLMMLGGFEQPTLGRIVLDGRPVERLAPEKRNIGFVFQNYALFPHMSVAENVAFPLRYRGIKGSEAQARVARALDMVHLGAFGERRPAQLSGGQQQRVALARALVFEPSLVLMDEPLGALDKQLREHMQVEIKHLQTSLGITMVYVTHDQSEALVMSDRIAVFHEGRIQQLADPRTLYEEPVNRFVAGFIGENNLLPGVVVARQGAEARVQIEDGTIIVAPGGTVATGQRAVLSLRPERLALAPADPHANRIAGTLRETFFLGDHVRLCVEVAGRIVVARVGPGAAEGLRPGEAVTLCFGPADGRLLAE